MKEIELKLTLDEVNLILKGLGEQPFRDVFELIGKINQQANEQLTGDMSGAESHPSDLNSNTGSHE